EAFLRAYSEPGTNVLALPANSNTAADGAIGLDAAAAVAAADDDTITVPAASSLAYDKDAQLPLGDGVLTNNYGVPLIVVCTKADLMGKLERDRDFKEEQFDYIQQVLRTVCLKYGAALFYTSHTRPQSFDVLRSYLLHRLFPPAPVSGAGVTGTDIAGARSANGPGAAATTIAAVAAAGSAGGAAAVSFPFTHRAATLAERETLLVPTGWDSWGKINALREGFDCKGWGLGWDFDCEVERRRRVRRAQARRAGVGAVSSADGANGAVAVANGLTAPGLSRSGNASEQGPNGTRAQQVEEAEIEKEVELDIRPEDRGVGSAVRLYEDIVSDVEGNTPHHAPTSTVKPPDDQDFLQQWYATLAARRDDGQGSSSAAAAGGASLTGGVGSSSASAAMASLTSPGAGGRDSPRPMSPGISDYLQNVAAGGRGGNTSSPMSGARGGTRQSEVLHSFFQSLLDGSEAGGNAGRRSGLSRGARGGTPGPTSGTTGAPSQPNAGGSADNSTS
ncbi:hypothetical protein OC846_004395, partial [Tilletia horrida]